MSRGLGYDNTIEVAPEECFAIYNNLEVARQTRRGRFSQVYGASIPASFACFEILFRDPINSLRSTFCPLSPLHFRRRRHRDHDYEPSITLLICGFSSKVSAVYLGFNSLRAYIPGAVILIGRLSCR